MHEPDRNHDGSKKPQTPCRPPLAPASAAYLRSAGAICYPMGSFYTSVLANLLPQNVGKAIAAVSCPKIFIPNTGTDAELHGLTVAGQAAMILRHLREDAPDAPSEAVLHTVLVDTLHGRYEGRAGRRRARGSWPVWACDWWKKTWWRNENDPNAMCPELTAKALLGRSCGSSVTL